jgi:hypothetical protein
MIAAGNWVALRRGILRHRAERKMSTTEFACFVELLLEADCSTGIVWTNPTIHAAKYGHVKRSAQHAFDRLSERHYIQAFPTAGSHYPHAILLNKYVLSRGDRKGMVLNAEKSRDYKHPVYEAREEVVEDVVQEVARVHIRDVKKSKTARGERQPRKAAAASNFNRPSANGSTQSSETASLEGGVVAPKTDTLFQAAKQYGREKFWSKRGQYPCWGDGDYAQLAALLKRQAGVTFAEFARRWDAFLDSTHPFLGDPAKSLKFFCSKFDAYHAGPVLAGAGQIGGLTRELQKEVNTFAAIDRVFAAGSAVKDSGGKLPD